MSSSPFVTTQESNTPTSIVRLLRHPLSKPMILLARKPQENNKTRLKIVQKYTLNTKNQQKIYKNQTNEPQKTATKSKNMKTTCW